MSTGNKKSLVKPLVFLPNMKPEVTRSEESDVISDDRVLRMRKILADYAELNKLYDQCLERIQNRKTE